MQPLNSPMPQTQTPSPAGYSPLGNPGAPTAPGLAPLAQQLQTQGRGQDSMLVHMTPGEVQGLQSLAERFGGSLSSNPSTGLPEAGFLSDILPTLLGVGMSFIPGVGPLAAAALVGGGTGLITGDLSKGLMAGLGAFGGASLGGALGAGSVFGGGAAGAAGAGAGAATAGANAANAATLAQTGAGFATPATAGTAGALSNVGSTLSQTALGGLPGSAIGAPAASLGSGLASAAPSAASGLLAPAAMAPAAIPGAAAASPGFIQKFGMEAARGLGGGAGTPSMLRTGLAATGAAMPFLNAMSPKYKKPEEEDDGFNYEGPYRPTERISRFRGPGVSRDSSEFQYFQDVNPYPGFQPAPGFAEGGVALDDGSFIIDARTVSELGNGSSEAGQELLARMGGEPIKGKGDGVSDSIPARIGGDQEARVARDEVQFDAEAVRRLGGGDANKGAKRLYAIMDKAHAARKTAKRGEDTGVRKHLGA